MKILSVNKFYYLKGGSETAYFSTNALLEENGHTIIPFSMKNERNFKTPFEIYFIEEVDYDENKQSAIKKILSGFKILWSGEAKKKIAQLIDQEKPDIAHLHIFQHQITPSILWEIKKHKIPIVYTAHDLKLVCPAYLMQNNGQICEKCQGKKFIQCTKNKCIKNSALKSLIASLEGYLHLFIRSYDCVDKIIAPSCFLQSKLMKYRIKADQIVNVPNFIRTDEFNPAEKTGDYILFIGRLSKEKGVFTLLHAMKSISLPLKIAGTGPEEELLKKFAADHKLEDKVEFLGYKQKSELSEIIRNCTLGVITSECYENYPYSVLEFMACGKPVVGSKLGGIPEMIEHNYTGLLFEAGNMKSLSETINLLASNPSEIERMGKNARKQVEKNNSPSVYYERLFKVYTDLVNK